MCFEDFRRPLGVVTFMLVAAVSLMATGAALGFWQTCIWSDGQVRTCVYSESLIKENPYLTLVILSTVATFLAFVAALQTTCRMYGRGGTGLGISLLILEAMSLALAIGAIGYYYGDDTETIKRNNGALIYVGGMLAMAIAIIITFIDMGVACLCVKK